MGKKGKRAGKAGGAAAKQGPGKARRERAALLRDVETRVDALIERLEEELRDVDVFSPLQYEEDCPICFLRLPYSEQIYYSCCGKNICGGCVHSHIIATLKQGKEACPFCRSVQPASDAELLRRMELRVQAGDTQALRCLAGYYKEGKIGLPKDELKALEHRISAAEMGCVNSLGSIALAYRRGDGVEVHLERARRIAVVAAKRGNPLGHHQLACCILNVAGQCEMCSSLVEQAVKHWNYAACAGVRGSMESLRNLNGAGMLGKEELDKVEEKFKEARLLEWSEDREAYETSNKEFTT